MKRVVSRIVLGSTILSLGLGSRLALAADSSVQNVSELPPESLDAKIPDQDASLLDADSSPNPSVRLAELPQSDVQPIYTDTSSDYHLKPLLPSASSSQQGQVTSVSQLSDVSPTDWAFQAVQSLVERYGCIAGYPDGTFRGNRQATRYELAAALNACLDQISDRFATKEDLDALKALQEEFAAELATLRGRVDGLEARTSTLEAQQFSTTTKLAGEAVFTFSGLAGDVADGINGGPDISNQRLSLTQRTRLAFVTSFTGKDRLFTRLQSSNRVNNFAEISGTPATRVAIDTGDSGGSFVLDRLDYKFPIGKDVDVTVFTNAAFVQYYATTTNPNFEGFGGGKGAVSWFGERNPIFRNGTVGVSAKGVGTTWRPTKDLRVDAGYFANVAQSPVAIPVNGDTNGGLFGGGYSALAQLSYQFQKSQVALTYIRTDDPTGLLRHGGGTTLSGNPFGATNPLLSDSVGAEWNFGVTDNFDIGGWVGYTFAHEGLGGTDNANILNGAINFAVKNVGKEGATAGFIAGVQPFVINNDNLAREDSDPPIHLEANYQFPVNKNILITPGVFYVFNPDGDSADDGIFVGVIRTTFTF